MKKTIVIYGLALAGLIFLLKLLEYKFFIRSLRLELYLGLIAILFTVVGVWAGTRLMAGKKKIITEVVTIGPDFDLDEDRLKQTGISTREYEVLELMSKGMSNQEIADSLFVSLNTVKTHASNLYVKLDVKRRTQAVQRAKEMHLIP